MFFEVDHDKYRKRKRKRVRHNRVSKCSKLEQGVGYQCTLLVIALVTVGKWKQGCQLLDVYQNGRGGSIKIIEMSIPQTVLIVEESRSINDLV